MSIPDFSALVSKHRNYFRSGATRPVEWREGQLTALRAMMTEHAEAFYEALWTDLRRNRTDADLTDVKYLADEAEHALGHLQGWMKPVPVGTPNWLTPSNVEVRFDALGVGDALSQHLITAAEAEHMPAAAAMCQNVDVPALLAQESEIAAG